MLKYYKTNQQSHRVEEIREASTGCWIDLVSPDYREIEKVVNMTHIDRDLIMKMLDDDELPRIESSGNATLIVIDVPAFGSQHKYVTSPLGIIITENNYLITVSLKTTQILNDFRSGKVRDFRTAKKTRFLIQILSASAAQYLRVLDDIYREIEKKEDILKRSTENEDLIDLLSTEKTLVYFTSSLRENDTVLDRLGKGTVLPLYEGDLDLLEDTMIEIHQAIDMADIYRKIITSIAETYSTVISNNLNNTMQILASATIVLSIPTIISSFLGMNVQFGILGTHPDAAWWILGGSIVVSIVIAIILKKKKLL